jgi:hypothetical protein
VSRAKAGVRTEEFVELRKEIAGESDDAFILGKWHMKKLRSRRRY